jgi:putative nucleotidyltransferase with HDIG domain/PAS domain S-box-containing protein
MLVLDLATDVYADPSDRMRILSLVREKEGAEYEVKVKKKGGEVILTHCFMMPVRDSQKNVVCYRGVIRDITETRKTEEELKKGKYRNEILDKIANVFLLVPDEEMYSEVLSIIRATIDSKFGLFGYLSEKQDLIIPSLTREIWKECLVKDKSIEFPKSTWGESIWGRAIAEKRVISSSGPFHIPAGHIRFKYFIASPIIFNDNTIGLFSLARDTKRYSEEDKEICEFISKFISPILNARLQRDIKEYQKIIALDALSINERNLKIAQHIAHLGNWEFDVNSKSFQFSDEVFTILGLRNENRPVSLAKFLTFVHDDDKALVKEAFQNKYQQTPSMNLFHRILPKNTLSIRYVNEILEKITDPSGHVIKLIGTIQDITEIKNTQEKLEKREFDLKEAQRVGRIGSWDWDSTTDTITWSEEYYKIYGFDPSKSPPGYEEHLKIYTDESAASLDAAVKHSLKTGKGYQLDLEFIHLDGTHSWVTARGEVKSDPGGKIIGLRGTAQDINDRKLAENKIQKQLMRLSALRKIDIAISSSFDLNYILNIILDQITQELQIDAAVIFTINRNTFELESHAIKGINRVDLQPICLKMGEGFAGQAALEGRLIHFSDLPKSERNFLKIELMAGKKYSSVYAIPLIAKGQINGVLEILNQTIISPDDDWMEYFELLAKQTAIAIDNIGLFQGLNRSNLELRKAYDETIEGWSGALDLRDKETEGHTQRVTELTIQLAKKMGVADKELIHIRRGALLHDIGKMGVPDAILFKADNLSESEWELMRKHPTFAYKLISPITFLQPALDIPYCHHEKWDGTGYPRGLKREEIPLSARLFAVIDVWDALLSDRPYRKGWPPQKALQHILDQSGKHFDPEVVEAFLELITDRKK